MQNYRNGKWVDQILSQRREDGLWGNFHTLSCPVPGRNYTTEQAIRRLYYLGYTAEDEVIQPVLKRMEQCITGELDIDSYSEKKHDWVFFEKLMLAAWLRIFEPQNETALEVAYQWAQIVEKAFASGSYSVADDIAAFTEWNGFWYVLSCCVASGGIITQNRRFVFGLLLIETGWNVLHL